MGIGTPSIHNKIPRPIAFSRRQLLPACTRYTTRGLFKRSARGGGGLRVLSSRVVAVNAHRLGHASNGRPFRTPRQACVAVHPLHMGRRLAAAILAPTGC
jgi:hypothetical protein